MDKEYHTIIIDENFSIDLFIPKQITMNHFKMLSNISNKIINMNNNIIEQIEGNNEVSKIPNNINGFNLTNRRKQILFYYKNGVTVAEIANLLNTSKDTVYNTISIMKKNNINVKKNVEEQNE